MGKKNKGLKIQAANKKLIAKKNIRLHIWAAVHVANDLPMQGKSVHLLSIFTKGMCKFEKQKIKVENKRLCIWRNTTLSINSTTVKWLEDTWFLNFLDLNYSKHAKLHCIP